MATVRLSCLLLVLLLLGGCLKDVDPYANSFYACQNSTECLDGYICAKDPRSSGSFCIKRDLVGDATVDQTDAGIDLSTDQDSADQNRADLLDVAPDLTGEDVADGRVDQTAEDGAGDQNGGDLDLIDADLLPFDSADLSDTLPSDTADLSDTSPSDTADLSDTVDDAEHVDVENPDAADGDLGLDGDLNSCLVPDAIPQTQNCTNDDDSNKLLACETVCESCAVKCANDCATPDAPGCMTCRNQQSDCVSCTDCSAPKLTEECAIEAVLSGVQPPDFVNHVLCCVSAGLKTNVPSQQCLSCYAAESKCVKDFCTSDCQGKGSTAQCRRCRLDNACYAQFASCSGLAPLGACIDKSFPDHNSKVSFLRMGEKNYTSPLTSRQYINSVAELSEGGVVSALNTIFDNMLQGLDAKDKPIPPYALLLELKTTALAQDTSFTLSTYDSVKNAADTTCRSVDPAVDILQKLPIKDEQICVFNPLLSSIVPAGKCDAKGIFSGTIDDHTATYGLYLDGQAASVQIRFPVPSGAAATFITLRAAKIEVSLLKSHQSTTNGVWLGYGPASPPEGVISGVMCRDDLAAIFDLVVAADPGLSTTFDLVKEELNCITGSSNTTACPGANVVCTKTGHPNDGEQLDRGIDVYFLFRAVPALIQRVCNQAMIDAGSCFD